MALLPTLSYFQTLFIEIILVPMVWVSPMTLSLFGIMYLIAYLIDNAGY